MRNTLTSSSIPWLSAKMAIEEKYMDDARRAKMLLAHLSISHAERIVVSAPNGRSGRESVPDLYELVHECIRTYFHIITDPGIRMHTC